MHAVNDGERNFINWTTSAEKPGDYFELRRSFNGRDFSLFSRIDAKGHVSKYSYQGEQPLSGINYYRLKLIHASGSISYSKIVSATVKALGAFTVEAYPNPVSDVLTVKVFGTTGNNATIMLTDVTGTLIKSVSLADDKTEINMSGLAPGVYLVKYSDSKQRHTIKVNKQ